MAVTGSSEIIVNRRRQGSLAGLLVAAVGVSLLISAIGGETKTAYLILALGAAFAIAYAQGRQPYVYLVATCTLLAFGAGMLLSGALALAPSAAGTVFLAVLALGPLAAFLIRPSRRWPVAITAVLSVVAAAEALGLSLVPQSAQPLFVPLTLLGVGMYLIVGPRRT